MTSTISQEVNFWCSILSLEIQICMKVAQIMDFKRAQSVETNLDPEFEDFATGEGGSSHERFQFCCYRWSRFHFDRWSSNSSHYIWSSRCSFQTLQQNLSFFLYIFFLYQIRCQWHQDHCDASHPNYMFEILNTLGSVSSTHYRFSQHFRRSLGRDENSFYASLPSKFTSSQMSSSYSNTGDELCLQDLIVGRTYFCTSDVHHNCLQVISM